MYRMIASGLIILDTFFLLSLAPALAQNSNAQCASAVRSAKKQMERIGNITVKVKRSNRPQEYRDYPRNRPYSYDFLLNGTAADSVMQSTKLLTAISTDIIKNCPSVSIVDVGQDRTDYFFLFGLVGENKVEAFECISPGDTRKLRWGYFSCV